ncbi:hypothetical protein D3C86_1480540 [compost metagenome]
MQGDRQVFDQCHRLRVAHRDALLGQHQTDRAAQGTDTGLDVGAAHAQRRWQGQPRIATPGVTTSLRHQATTGEQFGRLAAQRITAAQAGLHGTLDAGIHRLALAGQGQLGLERLAQLLRRLLRLVGQRQQAVDQRQTLDALGQCRCQQHRDTRAQGMAEQGKALPAELLGHQQRIQRIVPQRVAGAGGTVSRMAVSGQVEGDDAQAVELRRETGKAHGVVQPAVQGQHRLTVLGTVEVRRQLDVRQIQADFFDMDAHWLLSSGSAGDARRADSSARPAASRPRAAPDSRY